MKLELHILQSFAPSNLNRDDTNSPKQCDFGGYRRARVSSQSWKRAMHTRFKSNNLIPESSRSVRTKRLVEARLVPAMVESGRSKEEAEAVAWALLGGLKIAPDSKHEALTQYLLFLGESEIDNMVSIMDQHWDDLVAVAASSEGKKKKDKAGDVSKEIVEELSKRLDGGRAASVALFGRMLADAPGLNRDAAAQVAHAISTHAVNVEFDFFTAVDDLKGNDVAGADMIGTVEFNSACFYRYLNVDIEQLRANLHGDEELLKATVSAFVEAACVAVPTGKQNSMAAHNPPSVILAVVGANAPRNLANAFVKPVNGMRGDGLVAGSAIAMLKTRADLNRVYGTEAEVGAWLCSTEAEPEVDGVDVTGVGSLAGLIDVAVAAACVARP
jgi:CRISPR system Cascade subunit CasC